MDFVIGLIAFIIMLSVIVILHELGHFMLHIAPSFKDDVIVDDTIELNRDSNWNVIEMEANKFAAELLMPLEEIIR